MTDPIEPKCEGWRPAYAHSAGPRTYRCHKCPTCRVENESYEWECHSKYLVSVLARIEMDILNDHRCLVPLDEAFRNEIQELTAGVEVDLDEALPPDDE